jgi:hypothetical protein
VYVLGKKPTDAELFPNSKDPDLVFRFTRYLIKADKHLLHNERYNRMARELIKQITLTDLDRLRELFP